MEKNFDRWNRLKKFIDAKNKKIYVHPREIWWCSLGVNIGVEADGKDNDFERPVLILRVYNKESVLVLPLTTKIRNDQFHFKINTNKTAGWVKLTQIRMVSTKRLQRKIEVLDHTSFIFLRKKLKELL